MSPPKGPVMGCGHSFRKIERLSDGTHACAICRARAGRKREAEPEGCLVCGAVPTVEETGLCGPCCFGEAETIGGNW